jgi:hypothetical protein
MKRAFILCLLVWLVGILPTNWICCAQDFNDARAVQAAGEALRQSANFPWYDAEQDALRDVRALRSSADDSETRQKGWQATAKPIKPPATPVATGAGWTGWNMSASLASFMQYFAMTLLAIAIIVLVVLLIRYFLKEEELQFAGNNSGNQRGSEESPGDAVRLENLPFQVQEKSDDPLVLAKRWYEQGRYSEAVMYLFAYQLMQLDRHQWIHLAKGKTNRQYLREVKQNAELRRITEHTMIAFEDVFFGHHHLPRDRFETCWQRLDRFHQLVESKLLEQGAVA